MKRLLLSLAFVCAVVFGGFDPTELKPVIEKTSTWDLTGKSYCRVKLADGSKVELKSDRPLIAEQWKKKAEDYQKNIDALPKPQFCLTCGSQL